MINCETVKEHLHEFLDKELDAETGNAIIQHIKLCRDCFEFVEFERILKRFVFKCSTTIKMDPSVKGNIYSKLREWGRQCGRK